MTTSLEQALLYFVGLRVQVRGNPAAREIVDRCLALITAARTADADTLVRLDAEVEALRLELEARLGKPRPVKVH